MMTKKLAVAAMATAAATLAFAGSANAQARDQIRIVGSSTVFPFTSAVAESFGRGGQFKTPVVESTGTGGGFKLFCAGVGPQHPDMTGASRPIRKSELEECAKNGVAQVTEMKVGFDGIVIANARSAPQTQYKIEHIWQALAKNAVQDGKLVPNPYKTWNQIDPSLPNKPIEVLGPPPTSGTRDAFVELVMDVGCAKFDVVKALQGNERRTACQQVREDGAYVEAGENDNLIVQKLAANPNAYGIFGYSFLDQNKDKLQGSIMDGVKPEYELIASGKYPVSRSMFVYVKNAHAGVIPGIREFLAEYTSDRAMGEDGYLVDKGLIALPKAEREKTRTNAVSLTPMTM